ncbi:serine/threonine-protein kinase [Actinomadura rupiterrae]|uniref:serine/threonine-protein kinase n=1 Tax=Actinomadura rupiterrae TaxID=559627 RepID=UPI0020A36591|nr:serine/threonine protein kinase [Actinomadura rupiterrae]MCP2336352.1 serine/threonine protein kinase [Actinomadura rupiterrae]
MEPLRDADPRHAGPYRLAARLGGGGMGEVYLGTSPGGMTVAVKIVRRHLLQGDPSFRRRFAREVDAARSVGGFYTAQVVDADTEAEQPWLATAYIPGPSLFDAVSGRGRPMPEQAVRVLGAGLAEGLAAIHGFGVVHRDLTPRNVILADGGPRIIDFGIARALDAAPNPASGLIGTPEYMSPEHAKGRATGPSGDVFSLGSVLAFAATGRSPFAAESTLAALHRVIDDAPDLRDVPAGLVPVIAACLAKSPDARPDVTEVLERLASPAEAVTEWLPRDLTDMVTDYRARSIEVLRGTLPYTEQIDQPPKPRERPDPRPDSVVVAPKPDPASPPPSPVAPSPAVQKPAEPTPVASSKAPPQKPATPRQAPTKAAAPKPTPPRVAASKPAPPKQAAARPAARKRVAAKPAATPTPAPKPAAPPRPATQPRPSSAASSTTRPSSPASSGGTTAASASSSSSGSSDNGFGKGAAVVVALILGWVLLHFYVGGARQASIGDCVYLWNGRTWNKEPCKHPMMGEPSFVVVGRYVDGSNAYRPPANSLYPSSLYSTTTPCVLADRKAYFPATKKSVGVTLCLRAFVKKKK